MLACHCHWALGLIGQTCLRTVTMCPTARKGWTAVASRRSLWSRSIPNRRLVTYTRSDREEEECKKEKKKRTSISSDVHVPARFVPAPIFFYQLLAQIKQRRVHMVARMGRMWVARSNSAGEKRRTCSLCMAILLLLPLPLPLCTVNSCASTPFP